MKTPLISRNRTLLLPPEPLPMPYPGHLSLNVSHSGNRYPDFYGNHFLVF